MPPLSLKIEMTEMALVNVPKNLQDVSVTIMDGAFFSLMPYPFKRLLYTKSSATYTAFYLGRFSH
ncbi:MULTISPECIES: hypothetical protein [Helicobacter]|uniref:hypothetical protein n=1 Tax=Helicobacter TaxID=209 RepID=UPI001F2D70B9|nr:MULTISPECIES: hypothetical protein [Helicobacter]